MKPYHKIQTVYKRDPSTKFKTLLDGEYSLPEFEYLAECEWVFTEKVDGTNIRIWNLDSDPIFHGRTDKAQIPPMLQKSLEDTFCPVAGHDSMANLTLYGEGYGEKIQNGGKYTGGNKFVLFDVYSTEHSIWLERYNVEKIAASLGIEVAPIIRTGTLNDMIHDAYCGIQSTWGDFMAEGYVARPKTELRTRNGDRVITKIKCKDFPS